MSDTSSPDESSPLRTAARRGIVPVVLGLICLLVSWPASEDLDPLLKGVGAILVALGLVIVVATARTLTADKVHATARRR